MGNKIYKSFKHPEKDDTDKAIEKFVKNLLQNANINIKVIPDNVEEAVYINILKIILNNLKSLANTSHIEFLNHRIMFQIEALQNNLSEEEKEENK